MSAAYEILKRRKAALVQAQEDYSKAQSAYEAYLRGQGYKSASGHAYGVEWIGGITSILL
jgi:hypothetical protein